MWNMWPCSSTSAANNPEPEQMGRLRVAYQVWIGAGSRSEDFGQRGGTMVKGVPGQWRVPMQMGLIPRAATRRGVAFRHDTVATAGSIWTRSALERA